MRHVITIKVEFIGRSKSIAREIAALLPDEDSLSEYFEMSVPAILPIAWRIPNHSTVITRAEIQLDEKE